MPRTIQVTVPLVIFLAAILGSREPCGAVPFKGEVDFSSRQAEFVIFAQEKNPIILRVSPGPATTYHIAADVQNLHTPLFDVSTQIEGTIDVIRGKDHQLLALLGKVQSRYTLLDRKPIDEVAGQFEIREGTLRLNSVSMGNSRCQGDVQLAPPYRMTMGLDFRGINFEQILTAPGLEFTSAFRNVDGNINLSGPAAGLTLRGKLAAYSSSDTGEEYQNALINFSGDYPEVLIDNSSVTLPDGMIFSLSGKLNLEQYRNLGKQIDALAKKPLVSQRDGEYEWTLKKLESQNRSGSTELKYLLRKSEDRGDPTQRSSDLLGVERKIEF